MEKINLYKKYNLEKFFLGGTLKYNFNGIDIQKDVINILDEICKEENLIPLNTGWNEINYIDFEEMLHSALQFNLGFTTYEVMNKDNANSYFNILMDSFDIQKVRCFTNWYNNPWKSTKSGNWNGISKYTIDFALAIIDKNNLLFIYVLFED